MTITICILVKILFWKFHILHLIERYIVIIWQNPHKWIGVRAFLSLLSGHHPLRWSMQSRPLDIPATIRGNMRPLLALIASHPNTKVPSHGLHTKSFNWTLKLGACWKTNVNQTNRLTVIVQAMHRSCAIHYFTWIIKRCSSNCLHYWQSERNLHITAEYIMYWNSIVLLGIVLVIYTMAMTILLLI